MFTLAVVRAGITIFLAVLIPCLVRAVVSAKYPAEIASLRQLLRLIWPSDSIHLKGRITACLFIIVAQRASTYLLPFHLVNLLGTSSPDAADQIGNSQSAMIFYAFIEWGHGASCLLVSDLWHPVRQHIQKTIATAAFNHATSLDQEFHMKAKKSELQSLVDRDLTILDLLIFKIVPLMADVLMMILALKLQFDWRCAIIVTISSAVYIHLAIRISTASRQRLRNIESAKTKKRSILYDAFRILETARYSSAVQREQVGYSNSIGVVQAAENEAISQQSKSEHFKFHTFAAARILLYIFAYTSSQDGRHGHMAAMMIFMKNTQKLLDGFTFVNGMMQSHLIRLNQLLDLFGQRPSIYDKATASPLKECQGEVIFKDVGYHYIQGRPVLENVSFRCERGKTTALVGETGCGKTTVFRLLDRILAAQTGSISVDGQNVDRITIESLQKHIAVVPQIIDLKNGTLRENLTYANPDATQHEIVRVCKAVGLDGLVRKLSHGLNTMIGDCENLLSVGERQRVGVARALLKKSSVLLLDEPTASLDGASEARLQDAIKEHHQGKTVIVIAHRLSTITTADQILVLCDGRIIEEGTHDTLLRLRGKYHEMWLHHIRDVETGSNRSYSGNDS